MFGTWARCVVGPGQTIPVAVKGNTFGGECGPRFRVHEEGRSVDVVFAVRSLGDIQPIHARRLGDIGGQVNLVGSAVSDRHGRQRTLETGAFAVNETSTGIWNCLNLNVMVCVLSFCHSVSGCSPF